jgi:hypothetical protein
LRFAKELIGHDFEFLASHLVAAALRHGVAKLRVRASGVDLVAAVRTKQELDDLKPLVLDPHPHKPVVTLPQDGRGDRHLHRYPQEP